MRSIRISTLMVLALFTAAGCGTSNDDAAAGTASADPLVPPALSIGSANPPRPPLALQSPAYPPTTMRELDISSLDGQERLAIGRMLYDRQNYEDALPFQYWGVEATGTGQYQLACLYALIGETDAALYWLQRAGLEEGVDSQWATEDRDLVSVWSDPRWPQVHRFLENCGTYWQQKNPTKTLLTLPSDYQPGTPIAALVWMHGRGSSPQGLFNLPEFRRFADELNIALIAVSGTQARGPNGFVWAGNPEDDSERLRLALDEVASKVTLAPGRVILCGFSQGAQAAAEVAARDPETYAGAIVMSPGGYESRLSEVRLDVGHARMGFVCLCNADEAPQTVRSTKHIADWAQSVGARATFRPFPNDSAHSLPPDFFDSLPGWVAELRGSTAANSDSSPAR